MANEKNNEREELHKTIWGIANELRGAVDGWSFKAYVLGAIFYRYISENITKYITESENRPSTHFYMNPSPWNYLIMILQNNKIEIEIDII